jgi:uncharacterized protein YfaS (alpha-2-macroglobulin family)
LSGSIRDFYLADARGQGRAARDLTATRLGGVEIAALVAKAQKMLKDPPALAKEPGLEQRLTELVANWKAGKLTLRDTVTLVRLTGFEVYLANSQFTNDGPRWNVSKSARLADLFRRNPTDDAEVTNPFGPWSLSATVIDNTVLVGVSPGRSADPWALHRGNFYQNQPMCLGFGCNGWNICGGFNCSGNISFCGGFNCTGFPNMNMNPCFGFNCTGFPCYGFQCNGIGGIYGQFGNLGGQLGFGSGFSGMRGFGGISGGFGGGFSGFGGGGFAGMPFAGGNMGFSQPFVGGQMGMSFGFNRDFAPGGVPAGAPMPGLGLGDEVVRRDFADSAFWTATLRTDKTGKASASFKVPDSLTNWRVQVVAVSPKLHVGTASARFKTSRPIMIWPMLPRAFTEGDLVSVFGTVHNMSDQDQNVRVHLSAENGQVMSAGEQTVKVPAKGNVAVYWTYRAGKPGMTDLLMSAKCDAGSDASLKKLPVVAASVPERVTASGLVGAGKVTLTMPEGFDPKTAQVTVTFAPTLAADLADTLPYLVEYPYGCVEQTMSRFLPAIRVAAILKQSGISTLKDLEVKLPQVVEAGQKRLIALQQADGGWAWQGNGQTHEMMTPYALFGLIAAEEAGYPCPNATTIPNGIARLKQYLEQTGTIWDLAIKQGWGVAFGQNGRKTTEINDVLFSLWVAALDPERAKKFDIQTNPWFARIEKTVGREEMSDVGHALALELATKYGHKPLADKLAAELHKRAQKSGARVFWKTAGYSRWGDNTTEVTATVMKALVAHDTKDSLVPGVLAYFHSTKRGDRWDSTKDTAFVLYALCDYLAAVRATPRAEGEVKVSLNGTETGTVKLDSPASKTVKFTGTELKAGENTIGTKGVDTTAGALVRVSVTFTRTNGALTSARDHGVKVTRTISLRGADGKWTDLKSGASVPVGSYVRIRATAAGGFGHLQYFLLESPKPAGFETVPADDPRFPPTPETMGYVLREDRESMTCFHYETSSTPTAEFVVLAEFAGEYTLPPARGELMYQPANGGHSDAFVLKVAPKK